VIARPEFREAKLTLGGDADDGAVVEFDFGARSRMRREIIADRYRRVDRSGYGVAGIGALEIDVATEHANARDTGGIVSSRDGRHRGDERRRENDGGDGKGQSDGGLRHERILGLGASGSLLI